MTRHPGHFTFIHKTRKMRYPIVSSILCGLLLSNLVANAQAGWEWGIKNTGRGGMRSWPSATDAAGNLYLAGSTYGSAFTIDSMVFGTHTVYSTSPHEQLIVTKVDTGGHYLWAIGSQGVHVGVAALAVDPSGNVFIAGSYTTGTMTLGTTSLSNTSANGMIFIAKLSSSGSVLWAQNVFNFSGGSAPFCLGMGVDGAGNAYITGNFYQNMVLVGFSTILTNHDPTGFSGDIYLIKYNSAGTLKWAKSFGGNHNDYPMIQGNNYAGFDYANNIMSVTPAGHIYLTGAFFSDSVKIGTTTLYNPYGGTTEPGPTRSYLCKWDSSGNAVWAKYVEPKMQVNEIVSNANEEVFFAGILDTADTWGSLSLAPGALIAKVDSTGDPVWVRTPAGGDAKSIGLDNSGNVYATGYLGSSMTFGSYVLYPPAVHSASMFVAKYSPTGTYLSSLAVADGAVVSCAIRPGFTGSYYLVGNFFGTPLTFGPSVLDTAGILSETTFIARYRNTVTLTVSDLQQEGDVVMLYPNPAGSVLTIKANTPIRSVQITDMLGREVRAAHGVDEMMILDISALAPGSYIVNVNNNACGRFVKE